MRDGNNSSPDLHRGSGARLHKFAPAEMMTCAECLRANPPTRTNCLYCAAILPLIGKAPNTQLPPQPPTPAVAENVQSASVKSGFYIVLAPDQSQTPSESSLTEAASVLDLKIAEVQLAVGSGRAVPLARAATIEQATTIADRLGLHGIGVDIFREDTLDLELPMTRVRALEFTDEGLSTTPIRRERISMKWDELILIVTGRWLVTRVEIETRRGRSSEKPLGSRELSSDEPMMDLHSRFGEIGIRIYSSSFDYSCLGPEKSVTALENFAKLLNLLGRRALKVEIDETYHSLKAVMGSIWPFESQTTKGYSRRSGAGKVDVSTVTTLDNENQFHRYSRLRQGVKLRELENDR